jgi:dihydrodipicolinate reductase
MQRSQIIKVAYPVTNTGFISSCFITRPEATLDYLATCLSANKAMVIGTMGFNGAGLTNLNNAKN